eukprot:scaffold604529_cov19-Prasinocladus_malaysianus.AAC.1
MPRCDLSNEEEDRVLQFFRKHAEAGIVAVEHRERAQHAHCRCVMKVFTTSVAVLQHRSSPH